jgi:hypothetical protein
MARIFDEKFEGSGYEEGAAWAESVGAGCTINEDAATSDVSSPTDWGSQCLKIIQANTTGNYVAVWGSDASTPIYVRYEFVLTAESLGNTQVSILFGALDSTGANTCFYSVIYQDGSGNLFWGMQWALNGSAFTNETAAISLNTKYRVEIKWDVVNHLAQYKLNGSAGTAQTLTAGHYNFGVYFFGDAFGANPGYTAYFDLFAIDDAAWIGAESSGRTTRNTGPYQLGQKYGMNFGLPR